MKFIHQLVLFFLRPRFARIGRTGAYFRLWHRSKNLVERANDVWMIANMVSWEEFAGKGIDTIS